MVYSVPDPADVSGTPVRIYIFSEILAAPSELQLCAASKGSRSSVSVYVTQTATAHLALIDLIILVVFYLIGTLAHLVIFLLINKRGYPYRLIFICRP